MAQALTKIMSKMPEIRGDNRAANGLCFGYSFTVSLSIFAEMFPQFIKSLNHIGNTESLALDIQSGAPKHIHTLANEFSDHIALVWIITVAHHLIYFKQSLNITQPAANEQNPSIGLLIPLFTRDLKDPANFNMIPLDTISLILTEGGLHDLFMRLNKVVRKFQEPVGLIFITPSHALSCTFNPSECAWVIADTAQKINLNKVALDSNVAQVLWLSLKPVSQCYRAVCIRPIATQKNQAALRSTISIYFAIHLNSIHSLKGQKLAMLLVVSENCRSIAVSSKIKQNYNSTLGILEILISILKTKKLLKYSARNHLDDLKTYVLTQKLGAELASKANFLKRMHP